MQIHSTAPIILATNILGVFPPLLLPGPLLRLRDWQGPHTIRSQSLGEILWSGKFFSFPLASSSKIPVCPITFLPSSDLFMSPDLHSSDVFWRGCFVFVFLYQ